MSVICKNNGIFVNSLMYLKNVYRYTLIEDDDNTRISSFFPKPSQFVVKTPHIPTKLHSEIDTDNTLVGGVNYISSSALQSSIGKVRKRRKRKSSFNLGEIKQIQYHEKIKEHLIKATYTVCSYLQDNYCGIWETVQASLEDHCQVSEDKGKLILHKVKEPPSTLHSYSKYTTEMVENESSFSHVVNINGTSYLIPMHCKFYCSDVFKLDPLLNDCKSNGKYSCIVLDPPWENKSVKRSKQYSTLSFSAIGSLPFHDLCREGCLVIVWVTNKQKIVDWVKESLFKKWNIVFLTQWHWVKLAANGEPVFPWDSLHKKPYETLLVGCYQNLGKLQQASHIHDLVICSVPAVIHSHKPSLSEIVKTYVKTNYDEINFRCLEMFARNLTPDWSSWGNEVLMLQNVHYYDLIDNS